MSNFTRYGFNNRASSVKVLRDRWEVCEDVRFDGRCVVLHPGRYPSLAAMGLNKRISSVRAISPDARPDDHYYAPVPVPVPVAVNDCRRQARPDYWEVTYTFRGQAHHVQMSAPPGPTVTVNEQGEPRA